ncbi:MAG: type I secretion system permease/ATPase [Gammaproteobacteria bacterium]|nr:type I secretion system permease/ATPase [Gammaproteobacteria bacterium]
METAAATEGIDTGLACLAILARLHGLPADPGRIRHEFGSPGAPLSSTDLIRAARALGFKAREIRCAPDRLDRMPLPAIAPLKEGGFHIVAGVNGEELLVQDPARPGTRRWSREQLEAFWTGRMILLAPRSAVAAGSGRFGFSWFVLAVLKYRSLFAEILLASFVIQLFALVTPLFFQVVVDKVLVQHGLTTLDVLAAGLLLVSIFDVLLNGLRNYVFAHTSNRIDVTLGADLFRHLLRLPLGYFATRRVGDLVARVRELEQIRNFITGSAITLVIDLSFGFVFLSVMLLYSPTLSLVVLGSLPAYCALACIATPMLRARLNEKFSRGAENQAFLVETLLGIETLKAGAVEPHSGRRWEDLLAGYVSASFRAASLGNVTAQAAALVNKLGVVLILWLGARAVIEGAMSVGQLIAFNLLAARFSGPVLRLVQVWQDFQQAGISLQRLAEILDAAPEPTVETGTIALPDLQGRIAFEDVTFRYVPDAPEILSRVSFTIEPGEIIGIVGRSGSGKSTLARLVQRLYVPEQGRVLVDGVNLAMVDGAWLRRRIGVVQQDTFLFNRSIRDNIALADPAASMERVVHAARLTGAHDFIAELPAGYGTQLEEHGGNLSSGQRQRIAIARALLGNPRVLILDEATSALDYESENILQRNMRTLCSGRTVLIIAHRLNTVRDADRILFMERGQIIEAGTHGELMGRGGRYARLYSLQSAAAG